ncbi:MAG: mechanosensitive ion channel family protein [Candidatus Omnitrophica bacterium]|jgi:small-conductance mechanosensitive channel|nr:mechanosensitive ion channel family protein [Candidatus Omnitrophota bacterium]MDD5078528.1 mechanosensitive ion channel family protein [Candidatus Omnitrophota bacterium]MDD5724997.1 mechanosensitive ion channel family protein [Candidatus Omnitrophota bacterium]
MNQEFLNQIFWGNRVYDYLLSLAVLFSSLLFVWLVVRIFVKRLKKFAARTVTTLDDLLVRILERAVLPCLYLTCIYISLKMLNMPAGSGKALNILQLLVTIIFCTRIVTIFLTYGIRSYLIGKNEDDASAHSMEGVLKVVKFIIWSLAAVIFLDNIGFKVSTVIAGLGIGGVAIAIAAQSVLKDIFSYFSIVFDRPFKPGDFIIIGDFMGTVEHIGIKTTRLRSLGGELLVFSNTDLTDSRVRNYKLMEKRRVLFRIGVTYQTSTERLKEIPGIIGNIIKDTQDTLFDRAHFFSYGDFSLIFEIVYYVAGSDYNKYMDIQQEINLKINEEFVKRGIEFAYPTQKLYLSKE